MSWALWFWREVGSVLGNTLDWLLLAAGFVAIAASYALPALGPLAGGIGSLVAGPAGRLLRIVGVVVAVIGGGRVYGDRRADAAIAEYERRVVAEVAADRERQHTAELEEVGRVHQQEADALRATAAAKVRIANVALPPEVCRALPAASVAVDELRYRRAGVGAVRPSGGADGPVPRPRSP